MNKYKLTKTKEAFGITLYRIKALKDFGDVKKGDLGGWIEKEENLSQENFCWVSGDARVFGNAWATKKVINLIGLGYVVTITDNYMQIGCENHPFEYWLNLKKEDILKMDGKDGMMFAKVWKRQLKKLVKDRQQGDRND